MYKLDGLVIQLCIRKFTGYDLRRKAMGKVVELEGEIDSKRALQQSYRDIAQELHENYSAVMKRLTTKYGQGFDRTNLYYYLDFAKVYPTSDIYSSLVSETPGQMDMYVKMYDEKYRSDGDNPTIGILLCADTDADVAKYSCLHDNDHLYMAKYLTYMPTQEELRREIEQQKMIFAANRILSMLNTYVWTDEHTSVQDCFRLRILDSGKTCCF